MLNLRPNCLSIAGFDPSAGAGILSDIKTFETHKVYGYGVISSNTLQNASQFEGVEWIPAQTLLKQLEIITRTVQFEFVKIGLVENFQTLEIIVDYLLLQNSACKIIWDPILKASAGFPFHASIDKRTLFSTLKKIYLLTPNIPEALQLSDTSNKELALELLGNYCHVLLKGGHAFDTEEICDLLKSKEKTVYFKGERITNGEKHGSGCILSAAILANLCLGNSLETACKKAKKYINTYLASSSTLLGYHLP
jgi:hydroxymethylpyrimidine/phosphomethylpyrimidine kinase